MIDMERGHHSQHIRAETLCCVIACNERRMARTAETATSYTVYVITRNKLWGERVEDMSVVSGSCEKHKWAACTSPIERFNFDILLDRNKPRQRAILDALLS